MPAASSLASWLCTSPPPGLRLTNARVHMLGELQKNARKAERESKRLAQRAARELQKGASKARNRSNAQRGIDQRAAHDAAMIELIRNTPLATPMRLAEILEVTQDNVQLRVARLHAERRLVRWKYAPPGCKRFSYVYEVVM